MVLQRSSSESSDSDDDNLALLREAADTDLINDSMFQLSGNKSENVGVDPKPANAHKSQRFIADDNDHIDDLLIPEEVQKFVSKKLTKIIESQVEFVDVNVKPNEETTSQAKQEKIKLLNDVVLKIDWSATAATSTSNRKRPEIRKRIVADVDSSKSENTRLREAIVDVEHFPKEVSNWTNQPKGSVFEYREKNGRLFEIEKETEFSEKRHKNNWDESKIGRNKKKF